jgi:hypothetical protein
MVYEVEVVDVIAPPEVTGRSSPSENGDKDETTRKAEMPTGSQTPAQLNLH